MFFRPVKSEKIRIFLDFRPRLFLRINFPSRKCSLMCYPIQLVIKYARRPVHLHTLCSDIIELRAAPLLTVLNRKFRLKTARLFWWDRFVQCYVIFHDFWVMKSLRKRVLTTKRGFAFLKSGLCRERGASLPLLGAGVFDSSGNLFRAFRLC